MGGILQKVALAAAVLSAFAGSAAARDPIGPTEREIPLLGDGAPRVNAGATVKQRGWTAGLFVSTFEDLAGRDDEVLRLRPYSTVGARLSGRIARDARVTLDVFNVFDQPAGPVDYFSAARNGAAPGATSPFLSHPAEGRGIRLTFRKTF